MKFTLYVIYKFKVEFVRNRKFNNFDVTGKLDECITVFYM